jgi:hypothetical protein
VIVFAAIFVILAVFPSVLPKSPDFEGVVREFSEVESKAVNAYNSLVEAASAGVTDEAFAKGIEDEVLPVWRHVQPRLDEAATQLRNPQQTKVLKALRQYWGDRAYGWTQMILALRAHNKPFLEWTTKADAEAVKKFKDSIK